MVSEICFMLALFLLSLLKKSRDILALFSYDTDRCSAVIVFFTFYQNLEKSARLRAWKFHGGLVCHEFKQRFSLFHLVAYIQETICPSSIASPILGIFTTFAILISSCFYFLSIIFLALSAIFAGESITKSSIVGAAGIMVSGRVHLSTGDFKTSKQSLVT